VPTEISLLSICHREPLILTVALPAPLKGTISRRVFPNRPVDTSENLRRYQRHHPWDPRCPRRWL